jgi:hypothetical protein
MSGLTGKDVVAVLKRYTSERCGGDQKAAAAKACEISGCASLGELAGKPELFNKVHTELSVLLALPAPAEAEKPSRFVPVSVDEFASGPEPEWIIDDLLPRSELAVIYGESGCGKSFWMLDLGLAVARGLHWRGIKTTQGKVVYVCAESPAGFKKRFHAYAHQNKIKLSDLRGTMYLIGNAPNLLLVKEVDELIGELKALGPLAVIVLDTLSRCVPGANENSGEDMGLALKHCQEIHKRTGALVALIHHSGKDAARGARGWSGIRAATDTEIEVTRIGALHRAELTKQRDAEDGRVFGFRLPSVAYGYTEAGKELSSLIVEPVEISSIAQKDKPPTAPAQRTIWDALKDGPLSVDELLTRAAGKLVHDPKKRDHRRQSARRGLESLVTKESVVVSDGVAALAGTATDAEFNKNESTEAPAWID